MLVCMGRLPQSPPPATPHQNRASMSGNTWVEEEEKLVKDVVKIKIKKQKEKDVEIKKLVEKKVESNYMSKRRFNHNDKLWIAKEEVKDLERLLKEAEERLNLEYEKVGGRTWIEWVWYLLGYRYN